MPKHSDALMYLAECHSACGPPMQGLPSAVLASDTARLRAELVLEEASEVARATAAGDIVAIANALADVVYVAYGAAVTFGIDLDAALLEVHRSNMTKVGDDGRTVQRTDGIVLKSEHFETSQHPLGPRSASATDPSIIRRHRRSVDCADRQLDPTEDV